MRGSVARLRELFTYSKTTGLFKWRATGKPAGTRDARYCYLNFDGRHVLSHRAAWAYVKGTWPRQQIDHKNGVKTDNRIKNLRDDTQSVNQQNQRKAQYHSRTGLLGVVPVRQRFRAQIWRDGAAKNLGTYDTAKAAHRAYVKAKRLLHAGCTI